MVEVDAARGDVVFEKLTLLHHLFQSTAVALVLFTYQFIIEIPGHISGRAQYDDRCNECLNHDKSIKVIHAPT